jgi:hypothetical protein
MEFTSAKEAENKYTVLWIHEDHFSFNCAVVYRIQRVNKTVFQCSVGHSLDLQGDSNEHDGKRVFNRSTVRRKRNMHSVSWLCSFHFGRRRTIEDGSFQRAFQTAYKEGKFSMKWLQLRIISKRSKLLESGIPKWPFVENRSTGCGGLTYVMEKRKKWAMKSHTVLVICSCTQHTYSSPIWLKQLSSGRTEEVFSVSYYRLHSWQPHFAALNYALSKHA